jgi:hypothetical protein
MEEQQEIKFEVDQQYENEKGIFTVVSLKKNDMVIRWESGEEIQTTLELQTTIQLRRQWEQYQREAKAAEALRAKNSSKAGGNFVGLRPGDFKPSAARTNWRGRSQLGGAVTQKISAADFKFNSWAYSTKSELHWQDAEKRKQDTNGTGARFFVRVDNAGMTYGFVVSQPSDLESDSTDWSRFYGWLTQDENQSQVKSLSDAHNLTMVNSAGTAIEPISDSETYIEISCKIDKETALARENAIAEDLATVFSDLVPFYRAAVAT